MTTLAGIASALLALLIAHGTGRLIFRDAPEGPLRLIYRIAAGLGFWTWALLAFGLAGLYTRAGLGALATILAVPAALGGRHLLEDLRAWKGHLHPLLLLPAALLLFNLGRAIEPTTDYDSLRYHLAAPKQWLAEGKIGYFPTITINGPAAAQGLNGVFLAFPGETGANVFVLFLLALNAAAIVAYAAPRYGRAAAAVAATAFTATLAFKDLIGTASDVPLFSLFALCALVALAERGWAAAAVFAGLAAGTKMTGLWIVLIAALLGPRRIASVALAAAIALPWYLKSWMWTGNPIWPFVFGGRDWSPACADELTWFLQLGESPWNPRWLASLAYRAVLWKTGGTFLLLAPLLVLDRLDARRKILLGAFCIVVPFWWLSSPQPRFLLPFYGALAILIGAAAARMPRRLALLGLAVLAVDLGHQGFGRAWRAWRGTRDERLLDFAPAVRFVHTLPPDAVVLVHGTGLEYRLERRYVIAAPIVECTVRWAEIRSADQLRARLRELGVTHVLTVEHFGRRYPSEPERTLKPFLEESGTLLFQDGRVRIYRIRDGS